MNKNRKIEPLFDEINEMMKFMDTSSQSQAPNNATNKNKDNKIDNLNLSKRTINCLKKFNILTLEELLTIDINLFKKERNVGQSMIKEIELTIKEFSKDVSNNNILLKNDINTTKKIEDKTTKITTISSTNTAELPDIYFLPINKIFKDNWIQSNCRRFSLNNIGLLANKFPDIFISSDEIITQVEYFEKEDLIKEKFKELGIENYPITLSKEQLELLKERTADECLSTDYTSELYELIKSVLEENYKHPYFTKNEDLLKKRGNKLKERDIDILLKRSDINYDKLSLEQIGQIYNVTRERIRQLEEKAKQKLYSILSRYLIQMQDDVKKVFSNYGNIFYSKYPFKNRNILDLVFKDNKEIDFNINYDLNIITPNQFKIEEFIDSIIDEVNKNQCKILSKEYINSIINDKLSTVVFQDTESQVEYYNNLLNYLTEHIIESKFQHVENDLYIIKSQEYNKDLLAYYFKKFYKSPVNIPQRNEEKLRKILKELFKACPFLNKYESISTVEKIIKENEHIVFYGIGKYIHFDNTNVREEYLDTIIIHVLDLFKSGEKVISPTDLYKSHSIEYQKENIPNEQALIGLINFKNNPNIECNFREMKIYYKK